VNLQGESPFTFDLNGPTISPMDASGSRNGLLNGAYVVTVTDAYGCANKFQMVVPIDRAFSILRCWFLAD
jgi:hypothetical protein